MCHSRHDVRRVPPAVNRPDEPGLRASDDEREAAVSLLREHGAAGRLDVDELEQRLGAAYAATTRGELAGLLDDLPGTLPAPRRPVVRRDAWAPEWSAFLRINLLLIAIWALTGAGYPWPLWVLGSWGIALLLKGGSWRSTSASNAARIRSTSSSRM
jgi:hypothetical protein